MVTCKYMIDFELENIIEKIYNPKGNTCSLPNVLLNCAELELLKCLANGKNLSHINKSIKIYSKNDNIFTVSKTLLESLEAFTLPHAAFKAIKLNLF